MTVSTNNYQIGVSGIASQNFHLTTPAIPDGSLKLYRGNAGSPIGGAIVDINAAGVVTWTSQPSFSAYGSNAATTGQFVLYSGINHNTGSHYNPANGRFTAPVAGLYLFRATVLGNSGLAGEVRVAIAKNGVLHPGTNTITGKAASALVTCHTGALMELLAGDYVNVLNVASPEALFSADTNFSSFYGGLVH